MQNPFANAPYQRYICQLTDAQLSNIDHYLQSLLAAPSNTLKQTHYFNGRYENIYVKQCDNPELSHLMDESLQNCAEMLAIKKEKLKIGYWFNLMQPGDVTTLHSHDDFDELVSGVIYISVPKNSGDLIIIRKDKEYKLPPIQGNFVYFDPRTPHKVLQNNSAYHRLSIGMNIGLAA